MTKGAKTIGYLINRKVTYYPNTAMVTVYGTCIRICGVHTTEEAIKACERNLNGFRPLA